MQHELTNDCSALLTLVLLSEEHTTPFFIKGFWGSKELQTIKSDSSVEQKLVINNKISNHRHNFCGNEVMPQKKILSSFEEIKNHVDMSEAIFPKHLMRFFGFFTGTVLHQSMADLLG